MELPVLKSGERSPRQRGRNVVFSVALLLTFGTLLYGVIRYRSAPPLNSLPDLPFNDLVKGAVDIRMDQSKTVFQLFLLTSGSIVGLLIARRNESALLFSDAQEAGMAVSALILLLLSVVCHFVYVHEVCSAYILGGSAKIFERAEPSIPDVLSDSVDYLFEFQWVFLATGGIVSFLLLVSAHRMKETQ